MSNKRTYRLLWRFLADNRNCRTYTSFEKKYLLLYLFQVWLLIHRKKRGLTNYYIMHFKKKITVEELAGTCTSSSTIHGYLDELKRRNSISIEICPHINKKARARATCSILRAYPDFYNMKRLRVVTPPPPWIGYYSIARLPSSIWSGFPDNSPVPIYTLGWRDNESKVFCPRTQHNDPTRGPFLEGPGNKKGPVKLFRFHSRWGFLKF